MLNIANTNALADNAIAINGTVIAHLTDADAQKILDIVRGMTNTAHVSTPTSAPTRELHMPEESTTRKPITVAGKVLWQEDFLTVSVADKQYRLYITCPMGGDKGKKVRYAIKANAKELGAKFAGDYEKGEIFWAFPTKKAADEFIKARKAYAEKAGK